MNPKFLVIFSVAIICAGAVFAAGSNASVRKRLKVGDTREQVSKILGPKAVYMPLASISGIKLESVFINKDIGFMLIFAPSPNGQDTLAGTGEIEFKVTPVTPRPSTPARSSRKILY